MSGIFEGDVLLVDGVDGGDIVIEDGFVVCDRGFSTAVYLSLFGGNEEDSGAVESNFTWWGHRMLDTAQNERLVSRFNAFVRSVPMSSANILHAEKLAVEDLLWMKNSGIVDDIVVSSSAVGVKRLDVRIKLKKMVRLF